MNSPKYIPLAIIGIFYCTSINACSSRHSDANGHKGPYEVVVSAADDLGIPCSVDLSSLVTKERMERFNPKIQKMLYEIERRICRFYDKLALEKPSISDEESVKRFDAKYIASIDFGSLGKYSANKVIRRMTAGEFIETVRLILAHQHPNNQTCVDATKKALIQTYEDSNELSGIYRLMDFANRGLHCEKFYGSNLIEKRLFVSALLAFSYSHPGLKDDSHGDL